MKGGILSRFAGWVGNGLVMAVVIGAILIAVVGAKSTASLYGTAAVVGGTSTGITLASVPAFFQSIKDGQQLVKPATPDKPQQQQKAKGGKKS